MLGALDSDGAEVAVNVDNASGITARATIEGNSGIYGDIINVTESQNITDATIVANNKLKLYGTIPYSVTFTSFTNSWVAGTRVTVYLPTLGIPTGSKFLIENVEIMDLGGVLRSTVIMNRRDPASFSTQRTGNYKDYFAKLISGRGGSIGGSNGSIIPGPIIIPDYLTIGTRTGLIGTHSISQGLNIEASGEYSSGHGEDSKASGRDSHAEGEGTIVSGDYGSHAEGSYTIASGDESHAEGYQSEASSDNAHAEGNTTLASGYDSHAEGKNTIASGDHSHAEGQDSDATETEKMVIRNAEGA